MGNSEGGGLILPFAGSSLVRASPPCEPRYARSGCEHGLQGACQLGCSYPQLGDAVPHEPTEQLFSSRSYVHMHLAPVPDRTFATKQSPAFHAVYEFHGAVMLDLQAFGQAANGWFLTGR